MFLYHLNKPTFKIYIKVRLNSYMQEIFENTFFNSFVLIGVCGKGAHGTIYKIKNKVTEKIYALKEIRIKRKNVDIPHMEEDTSIYGHINIRRYQVLFTCNRPEFLNKKKCKYCIYTYIISDYYDLTLRDFINKRNEIISNHEICLKDMPLSVIESINFDGETPEINLNFIRRIFKGIVLGVRYLHENKKIHRDLKPENIFFLDGNSTIPKIGDFGDLKIYDQIESQDYNFNMLKTCNIGTIAYGAPEICTCCYNKNVDVYSLGLIYFELLFPFRTEMERIKMFEELRNTGKVPQDFKEKFYEESCIIESCIEHNPCERFSSIKVLKRLSFFSDEFKQINIGK